MDFSNDKKGKEEKVLLFYIVMYIYNLLDVNDACLLVKNLG